MSLHVVIAGIDVDTRCLEIRIERQRLVDIALHDMKPHVLVDATIVAEEILVVPLEPRACLLLSLFAPSLEVFLIAPVVVDIDGKDILTVPFNKRCEVEAKGHHTILAPA